MWATRKPITANFDGSRSPRAAERRAYNRASFHMQLPNRPQVSPQRSAMDTDDTKITQSTGHFELPDPLERVSK